MAQSLLNLGGLEPFYGWYIQVSSNFCAKNRKILNLIPIIGIFGKNKNHGTKYINIIRRLF